MGLHLRLFQALNYLWGTRRVWLFDRLVVSSSECNSNFYSDGRTPKRATGLDGVETQRKLT